MIIEKKILSNLVLKFLDNNINEKENYKNKKYHLFTKAEMIMLSKTYIDYRNGLIDDLKENFTISNLKSEDRKKEKKKKKKEKKNK